MGFPTSGEGWRADFEAIVSELDYPMFVVTTSSRGQRAGCLVGFATQASIDPPRMLVGLSRRNRTYRVAREARALAVHCPGADQIALAELFGGRTGDEIDKFAHCRWSEGPEGLPISTPAPPGSSGGSPIGWTSGTMSDSSSRRSPRVTSDPSRNWASRPSATWSRVIPRRSGRRRPSVGAGAHRPAIPMAIK